jgi:adenine phosphoribosyltransferase
MAKLAEPFHADVLLAPESRGFIYAAAMAYPMNLGMVMARKPGKLPGHNLSVSYTLEYGQETLEIREDSFKKGQRVLLVDDLLATGGSLQALSDLVKKAGAVPVGAVVMIRLQELEGEKAVDVPVRYLFNLSAKK